MEEAGSARLAEELPPPYRLAVAYAPRHARRAWAALLALDRRLARAALGASEPLLGQVRLAWWRDRFRTPASEWPAGEPLLAALASFDGERAALEGLVDGWEQMIGEADEATAAHLTEARVQAVAALARILECGDALAKISAAARAWSRADLDDRLPLDRPRAEEPRPVGLPRAMRPLVVLIGLAARGDAERGVRGFLRIVRLGLFGR